MIAALGKRADTLPALARQARQLLDEGFDAVKLRLGRIEARDEMAALRTVKKALGEGITSMVDFKVRRVATRHIKATIDLPARQSPDWGQHGAHERALVTLSIMAGAVMLARAADEPGLSDSLREAALEHLSSIGH